MALIGKVIAMTGVANIMNDKGEKRALHPGDQIQTGDSIQTTAGVDVDVQLANGRVIHIGADQLVAFTPELAEVFAPTQADSAVNVATIDTVIQALEQGRDINEVLEETAAGGAGGSDGSHSAVYLERIFQALNSLGFADEGAAASLVDPDVVTAPLALFDAVDATTPSVPTGIVVTSVTGGVRDGIDFDPVPPGLVGDEVVEGEDLYFTVGLSGPTVEPTVVNLQFASGNNAGGVFGEDTATSGTTPPISVQYFNGTNWVTVAVTGAGANLQVELPAGVSEFIVVVPTVDDDVVEPTGSISLTASTDSNVPGDFDRTDTGTILDNDEIVVSKVTAGLVGDTDASDGLLLGNTVFEGDDSEPLIYTVELNSPTIEETDITLAFTGDGGNGGEFGVDTTTPITLHYILNGVETTQTLTVTDPSNVVVTLPAGVQFFAVKVPTQEDAFIENTGVIRLTASTVNNQDPLPAADGTILDDDVRVTSVTGGVRDGIDFDPVPPGLVGDEVVEGEDLYFTVGLSGPTVEPTVVNLQFASGNNAGGVFGEDTATSGTTPPISVQYFNGTNWVTVAVTGAGANLQVELPAGVSEFIVVVPTVDDDVVEPTGSISLTASTDSNVPGDFDRTDTGTILDNDSDGIELTPSGLFGEYFGYNDSLSNVGSGYRLHDNDYTKQNLDSIQDVEEIIAGRSSADVTFNARNINFGGFTYNSRDGNAPDLGDNTTQAYVQNSTTSLSDSADNHLYNFLTFNNTPTVTNATNATILEGDPHDTNGTSGLGKTTDAIIRLTGGVIVDRGIYDIKVTADDGFRLNIGGKTYAEFDGNQFIIERTFSNISFDQGGLLPIEILYWEQGGQAQLKIEVKLSSSGPNDWQTFGVDSGFAMFSQADIDNSGLVLTDDGTRYVTSTDPEVYDNQEFYLDVDGSYKVREIGTITGSGTINGTDNTDKIVGSSGNDTINAGDGDDAVAGNDGDDTLNGGAGDDILNGGAGNDTMVGGVGDDVYVVDSIGDIVTESVNGGTDTIQYEMNSGNVALANNIENATILHGGDVSITGNSANNILRGGAGSNTISGGDGDDRIYGGAGNDFLTGGSGNDVFVWELSDKGTIGTPSEDHITDFVYTGNGQGNIKDVPAARPTDSIDLRDLLEGELSTQLDVGTTPSVGNLLEYLNFSVEGGSTVINISSQGNFAGDGTIDTTLVDQRIVLDGVNLYADTGAGSQTELLQKLLVNGTLIVD